MIVSRLRPPPSRLLMIACLGVAAMFGGVNSAQAGPLTGANVKVYDDGVLLTEGVHYSATGGGVSTAWTLSVVSLPPIPGPLYSAAPLALHYSFSFSLAQSNQPGVSPWSELKLISTATRSALDPGIAKTLKFEFTDTGYTYPPTPDARLSSAAAATFTAADSSNGASFQSFADPANALFGTTVTTGLQTAASPGSPAGATALTPVPYVDFAKGAMFSLTNRSTFTLSDNLSGIGFSGTTTVMQTPEPSSMALLGVGLVGMAGYGCRRWRQRNNTQDQPAPTVV